MIESYLVLAGRIHSRKQAHTFDTASGTWCTSTCHPGLWNTRTPGLIILEDDVLSYIVAGMTGPGCVRTCWSRCAARGKDGDGVIADCSFGKADVPERF